MSTKDERKKCKEKYELSFLLASLGIIEVEDNERPDFLVMYNGMKVGIEHVNSFPTAKKEAKSHAVEIKTWQSFEKTIKSKLLAKGIHNLSISYCIGEHQYNDGFTNELADDIATVIGNNFGRLENERFVSVNCSEYHFKHLQHLNLFRSKTDLFISEIIGGQETNIDGFSEIIKTIQSKEKKLEEYKIANNTDIQEYWLSIYIPTEEYCVVDDQVINSLTTELKESSYSRIYLTNGRYIGDLQNGIYDAIFRLK